MSTVPRSRLPLLLWLPALALFIAGEAFWALNEFDGEGAAFVEGWFLLISSLAVATIGVLILGKLPGHRIGWLLYAIGVMLALSSFLDEYAVYGLVNGGDLPLAREAGILEIVGGTAFALTAAFLFLLFPDGRLPSRRWRPLLVAGAAAALAVTLGGLLREGDLDIIEGVDNTFGVPGGYDFFAGMSLLGLATVGTCGLFGLASIVVRFRKADGVERHQLEWVFFGGAFLALILVCSLLLRVGGVIAPSVQSILFSIGFTAIPVTMGIAILRYRLYDIDWIINRTLVYVPLTGILAGLYVAMTGLLRTLFTELTDWGSDAAIAFSTLVVAGSLTPLKNWLQAFVDRHFKETQDPEKEAKRLAVQARSVIEVLQQEVFLRRYLRELLSIFGAGGGAIRIGYSTYAEGDWLGDNAMVVELICEGVHRGHVGMAPRGSGIEYTAEDQQRFAKLSEVIAEVISINTLLMPPAVTFSEGPIESPALQAQEETRRLS